MYYKLCLHLGLLRLRVLSFVNSNLEAASQIISLLGKIFKWTIMKSQANGFIVIDGPYYEYNYIMCIKHLI